MSNTLSALNTLISVFSVNSLARIICRCNLISVIFKLYISNIFREITLKWAKKTLLMISPTLAQAISRCRKATCHYLSRCWPRYMSLYGVTRPQWVNKDVKVWLQGVNMGTLLKDIPLTKAGFKPTQVWPKWSSSLCRNVRNIMSH